MSDVEILSKSHRQHTNKQLVSSNGVFNEASSRRKTYIYTLVRETGWDGRALFFGFGQEDGEFFDGGHGDVASVVSGEEGLRRFLLSELLREVEEGEGLVGQLALPLRSRKKTADAIVGG